ncbi:MAG: hypothetical protein AABW50_00735 [Nanoarchaeota archaeon]
MLNKKLLLILVLFELFILVNYTPAESYLIKESTQVKNLDISESSNTLPNLFSISKNLLIGFLSIKQLGFASAIEINQYCCKKSSNGATCDNIPPNEIDQCENYAETSCNHVAECITGWCENLIDGTCDPNVPKILCNEETQRFSEGENMPPQCLPKCCVIEDEARLRTEENCRFLSGNDMDFRDEITTELECNEVFPQTDDINNTPLYQQDCIDSYFFNKFHRQPQSGESWCVYDNIVGQMNSSNQFQVFNDDDDEYETITHRRSVSSDPPGSEHWRAFCFNGIVNEGDPYERLGVARNKICAEKKMNLGNQEFFIQAYDIPNEAYSCLFNNPLQKQEDDKLVDDEDAVKKCQDNVQCAVKEVDMTSSANYNIKICRAVDTTNPESRLSCLRKNPLSIINSTESGTEIIDNNNKINECESDPRCRVDEGAVDEDNLKFKACVPRYPQGNPPKDNTPAQLCSFADVNCPVVYQKNGWGHWQCKINCNCEKPQFSMDMNDLCVSLGDCGSYINYIGQGTDNSYIIGQKGYKIDGDSGEEKNGLEGRDNEESEYSACQGDWNGDRDPGSNAECRQPGWQEYRSLLQRTVSDFPRLDPNKLAEFFGLGNLPEEGTQEYEELNTKIGDYVGSIAGATGVGVFLLEFVAPSVGMSLAESGALFSGNTVASGIAGTAVTATIFAAIGAGIGYGLAKLFGLPPQATTLAVIGGGVGGALAIIIPAAGGSGPAGWIVAIAVLVFSFLWGWITGWGDAETRYVEFQCKPWLPPQGGNDCGKCNEDPLKPCNIYRCESLGTMCQLVNELSTNPLCASIEPENNPPIITKGEVFSEGYEFSDESTPAIFRVRKENGNCITQSHNVVFTINTNELALCKVSGISAAGLDFEETQGEPSKEGDFRMNHTFSFTAPRVASMPLTQVSGTTPNRLGRAELYVKCKDRQNPANFNPQDYKIDLCVSERDTDVPIINRFEPADNSYVPLGSTNVSMELRVNEPAECRYSTALGTDYESMNNMSCETNPLLSNLYGWPCSATLDLSEATNKFYFKCKDQPGLPANSTATRNVNSVDTIYTIHLTQTPLEIDSIEFNYNNGIRTISVGSDEILKTGGVEFISVDMRVETSGGAEQGKAICYWGSRVNPSTPFWTSGGRVHTQTLSPRYNGNFSNYIKCVDIGGNEIETTANLNIYLDSDAPQVISNRTANGNFYFTTDEEASCYYRNDRCYFDLNSSVNGTKTINGFLNTEHIIYNFDNKLNYHVMCADVYDNSGCSLEIGLTERDDNKGPEITRVYKDNYNLKIKTDESAVCSYTSTSCGFLIEDGSFMEDSYSKNHEAVWDSSISYYIKCQDSWQNPKIQNECSVIIKPSELI